MKFDGENIKKTNMVTYEFGRKRIVYVNEKGQLFYKYDSRLFGTFKEYCKVKGCNK